MTHRNDSIKGSTKFYKDKTIQSTLDSTLIKNNKTKITDPTELIVNKPDNKSSEIKSIKDQWQRSHTLVRSHPTTPNLARVQQTSISPWA